MVAIIFSSAVLLIIFFQLNDGNELMPLQPENHHNIQLEDKDLESVHLIHSEQNQQILATEKPQVGLFHSFENSKRKNCVGAR